MIYCSNLCTEIAQNMAPVESVSTEVTTREGDTVVVTTTGRVNLWCAIWRASPWATCR